MPHRFEVNLKNEFLQVVVSHPVLRGTFYSVETLLVKGDKKDKRVVYFTGSKNLSLKQKSFSAAVDFVFMASCALFGSGAALKAGL